MRRIGGIALLLSLGLAACQDIQAPPNFQVSDGSAFGANQNPHFFFLPPLVPSPSYSGTFDATLLPYLTVRVRGPIDPDLAETLERCPAQSQEFAFTQGNGLTLSTTNEQYAVGWNTPNTLEEGQVYRTCVFITAPNADDVLLGFRDVMPTQGGGSVASDPVYMFNSGSNLAIKFRVEEGALSSALCTETPGNTGSDYDCTAQILNDGETAVCDAATCALTAGDVTDPTLFKVERIACGGENTPVDWIDGIDIPQYGGCMRITVFDPDWHGFINGSTGILASCYYASPPQLAPGQDESLQLHEQTPDGSVYALPPVFSAIDGSCIDPDPEALAPTSGVGRLAWRLRRGVRALQRLFVPEAAYAFHTGFGGKTDLSSTSTSSPSASSVAAAPAGLSLEVTSAPDPVYKMAWALPSQMSAVSPTTNVIGNVGDEVPVTVQVLDNGRTHSFPLESPRAVNGATVRFGVKAGNGDVIPLEAATGTNGQATAKWTLSDAGSLTLYAWGQGIGSGTLSMPNDGTFDAFGEEATLLGADSLVFTAYACSSDDPNLTSAQGDTADGHITPGEYAHAMKQDVTVNLGGKVTGVAKLFVGNDCRNLYIAFAVPALEETNNALRFVFDNTFSAGGDDTQASGNESADDDILSLSKQSDGTWLFRDRYLSQDCVGSKQADCGPDDPGPPDGTGHASWNPNLTIDDVTGFFVYEMAHPLKSGDSVHDLQRSFGQTLGFYLAVSLGTGSKGNTEWPSQNGRFKFYQGYQVEGPTP